MTEMKFFVYGSLTEGLVHFQKIKDFIVEKMPGALQAKAYRLKVGFPVVVEGGLDSIPGEVITVQASEVLVGLLDQFHGYNIQDPEKSLYFRKEKEVVTANGVVRAWVYVLNPTQLPKNAVLIEGGNWKESLEKEPALTEKLTERQRVYIQRLGATVGREIVPIDLPLYRELMKLELIVDKGRRLALSKLGHEVVRYLG
ncbi:MAG: hypothetical protein BroJett040_18510 [Oligoflexia bacterium]|nr:MAG: hypothetical protein BroJett040_18510 [Oligoflexia bacterium]